MADSAAAAPFAYVPLGDFHSGADTPHKIAIFDVATGKRVGRIPLSDESFQIAIAPGGRRAYVSTTSSLVAVDLGTRKVVKDLATLGGVIAVAPDGRRVFVTDENANQVKVIDAATGTSGTPIDVGDQPRGLVVDSQGTHAYTGNVGNPDSLSIVDLTTNHETSRPGSVNLDRPENLGIAPSGGTVYAANFGANAGGTTVAAFTPPSTFDPIPVGVSPLGLTTNSSGRRLYVAARDSSRITIVNTATNAAIGSITLPFTPTDLAVAGDGVHAVAVGASDHKLAFVNLASRKVTAGPIELDASDVAIAPILQPRPAFKVKPGISRTLTRFDASSSKGGPIAAYSWDFGDGDDGAGANPRIAHRYAKAGRYTVKLFEENTCDPDAVFGPLGVSYGGQTAFCTGKRTATKTKVVRVPKAAVAVVRTGRATPSASGEVKLKLACVRELPCEGKATVAWKPPGETRFTKIDATPFKKFAPKATRGVRFQLDDASFTALKAKGKLSVRAVAATDNPHHRVVKRSRNVKLVFPTGGAGPLRSR